MRTLTAGVIPGKLQAEMEDMPVLQAVARDFIAFYCVLL